MIRSEWFLFHSVLRFLDFLFDLFHGPRNGHPDTLDTSFHQPVFPNKVVCALPRRTEGSGRLVPEIVFPVQLSGATECPASCSTRSFHDMVFFIDDPGLCLCGQRHVSEGSSRIAPGIVSPGRCIGRTKTKEQTQKGSTQESAHITFVRTGSAESYGVGSSTAHVWMYCDTYSPMTPLATPAPRVTLPSGWSDSSSTMTRLGSSALSF